jgi:hypothetical protein
MDATCVTPAALASTKQALSRAQAGVQQAEESANTALTTEKEVRTSFETGKVYVTSWGPGPRLCTWLK